MKKIKIIICTLSALMCLSCGEMLHFVLYPKKPHPKKLKRCVENTCKEIVFIPMVHLAKPKYYKKTKDEVTRLKNQGYTVFYEHVKFPEEGDSLTLDTLKRKLRKVVNFPVGMDLTDPENKNLPKFFSSGRYVTQTPENSGYSDEEDIRVDLTAKELIEEYEQEFGEIVLSECDFKTRFKSRYYCDKIKNTDYVIKKVRDDLIANRVVNSKYQKIVLIYGKGHYKGIKERLLKHGFEKDRY